MKFIKYLIFICFLVLALTATVFGAETMNSLILNPTTGLYESQETTIVSLVCNGESLETDMPAILVEDRTMVPVRVISEKLGASVTWTQETQTVDIQDGTKTIQLTIGSPTALVDGVAVELYDGVAPILVEIGTGGRTMVPLRFVSEQLGVQIDWEQDTQTAIITTEKPYTATMLAPVITDGTTVLEIEGEYTMRVFEMSDRVVVDFIGALFTDSTSGQLTDTGNVAVDGVRYNQYDSGYSEYLRVARVVFDMAEGYDLTNIAIMEGDNQVTVSKITGYENPLVVPPTEDAEEDQAHLDPTPSVMLDAGHGGTEVSATHFGVDEKNVTLPITLKVGQLLEDAGLDVLYTRTEDVKVSLQERVDMANDADTDIFVSIHANAYPANADIVGAETYYLYDAVNGKVLAEHIQSRMIASTGANDRGTKAAGYYVITHTVMPAVLIETGFLTNEEECYLLTTEDYQWKLAEGIAQGILDYFGMD